jgi:hypothetical protein
MATEKKGYKVRFKPPGNHVPPGDAQPGDTFQGTVSILVEEDGTYCIKDLDGVPFEEESEEVTVEETQPPTLDQAVQEHRAGGYQM